MQLMQQEVIHKMSVVGSPYDSLIYSDSNNELMYGSKNDLLLFSTPWCFDIISGNVQIDYNINKEYSGDPPSPDGSMNINGTDFQLVNVGEVPRMPTLVMANSQKLIDVKAWIKQFSFDSTNTYLTASFPLTLNITQPTGNPWKSTSISYKFNTFDSNNNKQSVDKSGYYTSLTANLKVLMNPNSDDLYDIGGAASGISAWIESN